MMDFCLFDFYLKMYSVSYAVGFWPVIDGEEQEELIGRIRQGVGIASYWRGTYSPRRVGYVALRVCVDALKIEEDTCVAEVRVDAFVDGQLEGRLEDVVWKDVRNDLRLILGEERYEITYKGLIFLLEVDKNFF